MIMHTQRNKEINTVQWIEIKNWSLRKLLKNWNIKLNKKYQIAYKHKIKLNWTKKLMN